MRKRGSYTIEAAILMPLILSALSTVMVLGFRSVRVLAQEMNEIRLEWQMEESADYTARVRMAQAAVNVFGEE